MYIHTDVRIRMYVHTDARTRGSYCTVADIKGIYVCTYVLGTHRETAEPASWPVQTDFHKRGTLSAMYVHTYVRTYMYSTKYVRTYCTSVMPTSMPADP